MSENLLHDPFPERDPFCMCGSRRFVYAFQRFPMRWLAKCEECGLEMRVGLLIDKKSPPKPNGPYRNGYDGSDGWWL